MPERNEPAPGVGVHGGAHHLVLYPTWVGLLAAALVPPGLLLLGLLSLDATGPGVVTWTLVIAGTVLAIPAGWNFPRHVVVGPAGIERRCLFRRHVLPFSEVAAIRRAPVPRLAAARAARRGGDDGARAPVLGGLMAAGHGRRHWMLTDQPESREEYDHLAALLVGNGATDLQATRPEPGAAPTSLYRQRTPPLPR